MRAALEVLQRGRSINREAIKDREKYDYEETLNHCVVVHVSCRRIK